MTIAPSYLTFVCMKLQKVLTENRRYAYRSFRLLPQDDKAWRTAAARLEISQSEFLRQALRDKAREVLVSEADVGQGAVEEGGIGEAMAEALLERAQGRLAGGHGAILTVS